MGGSRPLCYQSTEVLMVGKAGLVFERCSGSTITFSL